MNKVLSGVIAALVLSLAGAGKYLTEAHEALAEEREAREQVTDALDQVQAQRRQARERAKREAAALAEARERERELLERAANAQRRAETLTAEAEDRDAEEADPWDCAVTPVPDDWIPERWRP